MEGNRRSYISEEDGSRGSHQSLLHRQHAPAKRKCCPQVRRIGSKGAVLVIMWTFLSYASLINPVYENIFAEGTPDYLTKASIIGIGAVVLIGPVAGLFASIYYGRYKTVRTSLWLIWTGNGVTVPLFILQWFLPDSQQILSYSGFLIAAVVSFVGFGLFLGNSVPFGLDQMPDASGEQIKAFIHWYTFSVLTGLYIAGPGPAFIMCTKLDSSDIDLILSLISVVLPSVTLCSSFLLRGWLTIEPEGINPVKNVCRVLKFAVKHKDPVNRSAFTYCEDERPSRMDLAKSKYGGPFTNEEVEDVKTCLRMVLVIGSVSIPGLTAAFVYMVSVVEALNAEFNFSSPLCSKHTGYLITLSMFPVYEIFFYPLIRKWIPSTLRRVGLAQTLIIFASLILLVSSTIWYIYTSPTMCMFTSESSSQFPVDYSWVEVPIDVLLYGSGFLIFTALLEFVCAQAPYNMRGLLVGLVHSVVWFSLLLGGGIYTLWSELYREKGPDKPSCGVWLYLFTTVATMLGCGLWCVVAKWYKKRVRDEPEMCRIYAENYYDH